MKHFYRRTLPHWHPDNADIFLTFRLHGSLPRKVVAAWHGPAPQSAGQRFVAMDRQLDSATGPTWLRKPKVADAVAKVLIAGEKDWNLYQLHAWVIMPNHVHMLITPHVAVPAITNVLKSASARAANAVLSRHGQPFWQAESYDHWVRKEQEFWKIVDYINANPVKAGLAPSPEDYTWSGAGLTPCVSGHN